MVELAVTVAVKVEVLLQPEELAVVKVTVYVDAQHGAKTSKLDPVDDPDIVALPQWLCPQWWPLL